MIFFQALVLDELAHAYFWLRYHVTLLFERLVAPCQRRSGIDMDCARIVSIVRICSCYVSLEAVDVRQLCLNLLPLRILKCQVLLLLYRSHELTAIVTNMLPWDITSSLLKSVLGSVTSCPTSLGQRPQIAQYLFAIIDLALQWV